MPIFRLFLLSDFASFFLFLLLFLDIYDCQFFYSFVKFARFCFFFAKFCPPVSRQVLLLSNFPRTLNHPNRGMARCTAKYNEIIQERAVFFSRDTFLSVTFSFFENCHRRIDQNFLLFNRPNISIFLQK